MHIVTDLTHWPLKSSNIVVTIGTFDGVHQGHQAVLNRVVQTAKEIGGQSIAITFSNHPKDVLCPDKPVQLLCTAHQKQQLIEKSGIDLLVMLEFTRELADHSAEAFLNEVQEASPFTHLILGHDAHFGKDRHGNQAAVMELSKTMGFAAEYLQPLCVADQPASSSLIRQLIQQGELDKAAAFLGRPYSLEGPRISGSGKGREIGSPTLNLDVHRLCLPPYGVYAVTLTHNGSAPLPGIANLGYAPTLQQRKAPVLEVHLFQNEEALAIDRAEVTLHRFIRPEQKFASAEELKQQIGKDIAEAKQLLEKAGI